MDRIAIFSLIEAYGRNNPFLIYFILFSLFILASFGLPIFEEVILASGIILSINEVINLYLFCIIAFCGILISDSIIYFWGKLIFKGLSNNSFVKKIFNLRKLEYVLNKVRRMGPFYLFLGRFIPTIKTPVMLTCYSLKVSYFKFLLLDIVAIILLISFWISTIFFLTNFYTQ